MWKISLLILSNEYSDAGANINQATYDATFTSLHHALAKGHFECAQLLVDRGADLNLLNEGGCFGTSLHYAVFKDNLDFVKYELFADDSDSQNPSQEC